MRNGLILTLLVIGIAIGGWLWLGGPGPTPQAVGQVAPAAVPVTADLARRQDVPIFRFGLGAVQAFNTVTIHVRVDGALDKVAFKEGQDVKAGDLLALIDPRPFQAALDQAVATRDKDAAQLANAEHDLERYITLAPQNFTSKQTVDTQRALVAQLTAQTKGDQAAIDNAKVQLGYTTIASPIDGRTGIRLVDQGNIVHATDPGGLVVITQLHPISVIFTLPEAMLPAINRALAAGPLAVEAWSQDDGEKLDTGRVLLVDNQIDPTTGTMKLKATFQNQANSLWPGQFVNAHLQIETRRDAVTVPVQAVQRGPKGTFVWVIKPDDKSVAMRPVVVGYTTSDTAVIDSGIAAGDLVVIDGQYRLVVGGRAEVAMRKPEQTAAVPEPAK
jgi:multidrug efflux system membrane fusion protein